MNNLKHKWHDFVYFVQLLFQSPRTENKNLAAPLLKPNNIVKSYQNFENR